MRIERLVVTGDVFRTTNGDPNQLGNVRWLQGEVAELLDALTGMCPVIAFRRNAPDDGRAEIAEWYRLLGHTPSVAAWAATYAESAPPALVEALRPDYEHALVIGFELSPLMRSLLDQIGVPWIDMELSPLRFLDDLAISIRFSWPARPSHPGLLTTGQLQTAIVRERALRANDPLAAGCTGACVFLAQTPNDRTLIKNGAFFADSEVVDRVAQSLDGRPLVIKPHPSAPGNPIISVLQRSFSARSTTANIYALLASEHDVRFMTISSSTAIEAGHFGHHVKVFHPAARISPEPITSLWAHRSSSFWRSALEAILPLRSSVTITEEHQAAPSRLRHRLGFWGWVQPDSAPAPMPVTGLAT